MNNSILIADQDSRCGKKITDKLLMNNIKVIQTVVNKKPLKEEKDNEEESREQMLSRLDWNCFSTISPKNIILQSKHFSEFTTAAVVFTPPEAAQSFINQTHIEIQKSIDFYFRSLVTITKEIINDLRKKPGSYLYLILNSRNRDDLYTSIYKSFINSVISSSCDSVFINGIENSFEEPEQFAEYFYNILQKERKTAGKWLKPLQMNTLFSSFSGRQ